MNPKLERFLWFLAGLLGAFFVSRSVWLAVQGITRRVPLETRDWILIAVFLYAGTRLVFLALKKIGAQPR